MNALSFILTACWVMGFSYLIYTHSLPAQGFIVGFVGTVLVLYMARKQAWWKR